MGRIEDGEAQVKKVEAEIKALEAKITERAGELAGLQAQIRADPGNVETTARAAAVREVLERLRSALPGGPVGPGRDTPKLQHELDQARQRLADVRRERQAIRRRLAEIERLAARYGADIAAILKNLDAVIVVFQRAGFPPDRDPGSLTAWRAWASSVQATIRSLPGLRRQLEEIGADPQSDRQADQEERSRRAAGDRRLFGDLGPGVEAER